MTQENRPEHLQYNEHGYTDFFQLPEGDAFKAKPIFVTPALILPSAEAVQSGADLSTGQCLAFVIERLADDPDYAWSWHCSLAMSMIDEKGDPLMGQYSAARFLHLLTGGKLDMAQNPQYIDWMKRYNDERARVEAAHESGNAYKKDEPAEAKPEIVIEEHKPAA